MWPDFVKFRITNIDEQNLLSNRDLDFKGEFSESTGEVDVKCITATIHHCRIKIFRRQQGNPTVYFSGSIHKLWNSLNGTDTLYGTRGFNGNIIDYDAVKQVIEYLSKLFGCKPERMRLQNIELGFNLGVPFEPREFLAGLLYHKSKAFEFKENNCYAQVQHQRYIIKIYDKSAQYRLGEHMLRFELKIVKMAELEGFGISSMADITEAKLMAVKKLLLKRLDEIVYWDRSTDLSLLPVVLKRYAESYSNIRFWEDTKPNHRDRHLKRLRQIIENYSSNFRSLIRDRMELERVIINREEPRRCVTINTSTIKLDVTQDLPNGVCCVVTGVDISLQRQPSFHLSHSGLFRYLETNPKFFDDIRDEYLPRKWRDATISVQIREIAHNIRNRANNQRIKQRRLYPQNQSTLFDIETQNIWGKPQNIDPIP